ncbi:MAG TPA: ABC transporter ATP-binding protein [Candidatus Binatia bacterium]|jgi:branched-chain amino acid transport system ATP-binding protein|nr:ABC transporter ATP-binding protein [Candidatus Binatia bacterium]
MLEVSNLAVDHGPLRALWDVSFRVGEGERVALLGANGAGKSTTLGALVGLYRAAEGTILYRNQPLIGRDTADIVEDGIALVPEGRRLFPDMTVRENLQMGAYGRGRRNTVAEGLKRCFALFPVLREKAAQPAGQLSGGQQQMVAIGRALMTRPRLLLLDEPFLGVAPIIIDEVMAALGRLSDEGVTLLLVEQNIRRAMDFVVRAYVIENGRTVLDGSREKLLGDPNFNSKFLGLE